MSDDISIYRIKCVIAVAQAGSESRAASRLHMTQPGVSRAVHEIEAAVGVRLFHTSHGGSCLTDAGKIFVEDALHFLSQYDRAVQRARNTEMTQTGFLHIVYSSFLCPELLRVLSDIHFERPDSPILRMTSLYTMGVVQGVLEGKYQVGIGYLPISHAELETREILDEELMLCIPKQHRLFHLKSISPQDLDREALIVISEHALPEVYKEITSYFAVLGIELNIVAKPFSFHEAIHMAAEGKGIAMVSSGWTYLTREGIAFRPLADKLLTIKSGVFMRRDSRTPLANDFQNLLWGKTEKLRAEQQKKRLHPVHRSV